ncbi:MAG: cytochrome P450 [bacterium]|nr:cytochrome P450 [bacterium]
MSLPSHHPFSLEYTANPHPTFERAHGGDDFIEVPEMQAILVHGYEAVRGLCDHPSVSRNPMDAGFGDPDALAQRMERWPTLESAALQMIGDDGAGTNPSILRELLAPDFRPGMIRKMDETVHEVVEQICAPLRTERSLDIVKTVQEVPLRVISRLLGIDDATRDADLFLSSAPDYFRGINPVAGDTDRDKAEVAAKTMFEVLQRAVEDRRANPQTDMVSQVIEIADERGDVHPDVLVRVLVILVAAGTDTTRLSTSLAVKTLLSHPDEMEALRDDRSKIKNAVMECLRFDSPTKYLMRASMEDFEFEGRSIPRGRLLLLSLMGAGWDPNVYPEPERFDVDRDLRGSLNFGFGSGYCLGVHLARLQVGTLLNFILDHLPSNARVIEEGITWDPGNLSLRELTALPVEIP